jgi:hypothetical protein
MTEPKALTVAEAIAELSKLPPSLPLHIFSWGHPETHWDAITGFRCAGGDGPGEGFVEVNP